MKLTDEQYKKWRDSLPEYTPTPEECEEIERAKEEFARGEFISFSSMEEMRKYFLPDDEDGEEEA